MNVTRITLFLAVMMAAALAFAQTNLTVGQSDLYGAHLTDSDGMSLYVYLEDTQGSGSSACVDSCTRNWPALTADGDIAAADGLDQSLTGTLEREDGTMQVTYNGWPLYLYARDTAAGDARGAALGQVFYLVSTAGEPLTETVEAEEVELEEGVMAGLMQAGAEVYATNCAVCHGAEGQGQVGPGLVGGTTVPNADAFIRQVLLGVPHLGMPPFAHLDDDQLASLLTFVRNSWGNEYSAVLPEQVAPQR